MKIIFQYNTKRRYFTNVGDKYDLLARVKESFSLNELTLKDLGLDNDQKIWDNMIVQLSTDSEFKIETSQSPDEKTVLPLDAFCEQYKTLMHYMHLPEYLMNNQIHQTINNCIKNRAELHLSEFEIFQKRNRAIFWSNLTAINNAGIRIKFLNEVHAWDYSKVSLKSMLSVFSEIFRLHISVNDFKQIHQHLQTSPILIHSLCLYEKQPSEEIKISPCQFVDSMSAIQLTMITIDNHCTKYTREFKKFFTDYKFLKSLKINLSADDNIKHVTGWLNAIAEHSNLTHLTLYNSTRSSITSNLIKALAKVLTNCPLIMLILSSFELKESDITKFAKIKVNHTLSDLALVRGNLSLTKGLLAFLSKLQNLSKLDLSKNEIASHSELFFDFFQTLTTLRKLTELNLFKNNLILSTRDIIEFLPILTLRKISLDQLNYPLTETSLLGSDQLKNHLLEYNGSITYFSKDYIDRNGRLIPKITNLRKDFLNPDVLPFLPLVILGEIKQYLGTNEVAIDRRTANKVAVIFKILLSVINGKQWLPYDDQYCIQVNDSKHLPKKASVLKEFLMSNGVEEFKIQINSEIPEIHIQISPGEIHNLHSKFFSEGLCTTSQIKTVCESYRDFEQKVVFNPEQAVDDEFTNKFLLSTLSCLTKLLLFYEFAPEYDSSTQIAKNLFMFGSLFYLQDIIDDRKLSQYIKQRIIQFMDGEKKFCSAWYSIFKNRRICQFDSSTNHKSFQH